MYIIQMNFKKQMEIADPKSAHNILKNRDLITIDVYQYEAPRSFYEAISILALAHSRMTYSLTQIPNKLKITDELRRVELIRLANPAQYPLKHILKHDPDSTIYLHVGRGNGELVLERDGLLGYLRLAARNSYKLPQHQLVGATLSIRTNDQLALSLDVLEPLPEEITIINEPMETFPIKIPPAVRNTKASFLRGQMNQREIQNRLLFIDIECANDDENNPIPISIAAFDYEGHKLMDEIICPRQHIARYCEHIHGLHEKDLIGKRDSVESLKDAERMMRGRIIVGHDLHLEHVALPIRLDQIAGVRDLQQSFALSRIMKSAPGTSWNLKEVTAKLGLPTQSIPHTAKEDAMLVREIYLKIEKLWVDTPVHQVEALWQKDIGELPNLKSRLIQHTVIRANLTTQRNINKKKHEEEKEKKAQGSQSTSSFVPPPMPQMYVDLGLQIQQQTVVDDALMSPQIIILDESGQTSQCSTPEPSTNQPLPSTSQPKKVQQKPSTSQQQSSTNRNVLPTVKSKQSTNQPKPSTSQPQPPSSNHHHPSTSRQQASTSQDQRTVIQSTSTTPETPTTIRRTIKRSIPVASTSQSTNDQHTDSRTVVLNEPTITRPSTSMEIQSQTSATSQIVVSRQTIKRYKPPRVDLDDSSDDDPLEITIVKGGKKWCAILKESKNN